MEEALSPIPNRKKKSSTSSNTPIATWSFCSICQKVVTPLKYINDDSWMFSFGKFLEVFFYNKTAVLNAPDHHCSCSMQKASTLYFGCGKLAARFTYETIRPFNVFVRRMLPFEESFHIDVALRDLERITKKSSELFIKFNNHTEQVSRNAKNLFGSAANTPEHLQVIIQHIQSLTKADEIASLPFNHVCAKVFPFTLFDTLDSLI